MQALVWILRLLIVVVLVWFAVKNAQVVTLYGLPDQSWQAPLVFVLLVAFVSGVVIGLLAWLPTVFRLRREVARLARQVPATPAVPPEPAALPPDVHGI
jgi:lipopolysaccharide assembly protein A